MGGEGAEEQAADGGEGGGAASGDAVAGEQIVEVIERSVDGLSVLETVFLLHKREEEIGAFVASFFLGEVMSAQTGLLVSREETALMAAGGKAMSAAVL